jgi:hypothetical protein
VSLHRNFASLVGWVGLVVVGGAATLPGCSGKKDYDDDDDAGESGASGTGGSGTGGSGTGGSSGGSGGTGGTNSVEPGTLGSTCEGAGGCNAELRCYSGFCIPEESSSGGTGGTGATEGNLGGPCYPNDTCNDGLLCTSGYCLPDTGTGGTGGTGGVGGTGGSVGGGGGTLGGSGGTAGGTVGGTGGTGGSVGGTGGTVGGTGGTGGGAGSSGGAPPSTAIVTADGWVADGSNTVGIVGPWYVFYDQYSSIFPLPGLVDFTDAGASVCVEGSISQSDEYGPTLALNLNQPDGEADPLGYVPADHGVTGFSFGVTGSPLPTTMQITYAGLDGSQHCTLLTPSSSNTLRISQTILDCWNGSGTAGSVSTSLEAIQFQLPVNYYSNGQAFSFCITNLTALTN